MIISVITPPASEPVTLAEAKLAARIEVTTDDSLVSSLITGARVYAETYTRSTFINTTLQLSLEGFPWNGPFNFPYASLERYPGTSGRLYLWRPPVSSVTSIQYVDNYGALQTLDPSMYQVQTGFKGIIAPAYGTVYPNVRQEFNSVLVTYVAGYGPDASLVPEGIKTAIKLMVSFWYNNRDAASSGSMSKVPFGVDEILGSYVVGGYI